MNMSTGLVIGDRWLLRCRISFLSACEMTYIVSSGALNSTHSLTHPLLTERLLMESLKLSNVVFPKNCSYHSVNTFTEGLYRLDLRIQRECLCITA